jgi:hypothetical protein
MHAVPPDDRFVKGLSGFRLRPGFELPGSAAFLGGKVNERLGNGRSAAACAHSQDLIDFSASGGI